jgi:sigma-E factor negative regulatory protein RseC
MIEAIATVVGTKSGVVRVEYQRSSACGHCQQASSCNISASAEDDKKDTQIIEISSSLAVEIGQQVRIGMPESGLLKGALLVYILPLFFIIVGAAIGQYLAAADADWPSIAGAAIGGVIGFMLIRMRSATLTNEEYQPVILGVTIPVMSVMQQGCH